MGLIQKIFGTHSENELKRIYPIADAIEALDEQMHSLSDVELKDKTREFKERLSNHLCNTSLMKNNTSDQLYAVVLHSESTHSRFPHNCISLRQNVIQCLSFG